MLEAIKVEKDVDGFSASNIGNAFPPYPTNCTLHPPAILARPIPLTLHPTPTMPLLHHFSPTPLHPILSHPHHTPLLNPHPYYPTHTIPPLLHPAPVVHYPPSSTPPHSYATQHREHVLARRQTPSRSALHAGLPVGSASMGQFHTCPHVALPLCAVYERRHNTGSA